MNSLAKNMQILRFTPTFGVNLGFIESCRWSDTEIVVPCFVGWI